MASWHRRDLHQPQWFRARKPALTKYEIITMQTLDIMRYTISLYRVLGAKVRIYWLKRQTTPYSVVMVIVSLGHLVQSDIDTLLGG